jgi:hypothetical protein
VWAGSLQGVAQVALALVATLVLLSLVYGVTDRTSGQVIFVIVLAWLVAIGGAFLVLRESLEWERVARPGQCPDGSLVIDDREVHRATSNGDANASEDVLCIEDTDIVAGTVAGVTLVVLVVAGVWLIVARIRRK